MMTGGGMLDGPPPGGGGAGEPVAFGVRKAIGMRMAEAFGLRI
jgi:hypothetical protein